MSSKLKFPTPLADRLCEEPPTPVAVPLVSIDTQGFPHVALLSYFELIYQNGSLFFFLDSASRSAAFLKERGRSVLVFVESDFVYYVKGRSRIVTQYDSQSIFQLRITSVREDVPSPEEGEVWLKTGILVGCSRREARRRIQLRRGIKLSLLGSAKKGDSCP